MLFVKIIVMLKIKAEMFEVFSNLINGLSSSFKNITVFCGIVLFIFMINSNSNKN